MKNSSSGNDVIAIGKNMVNQLSRVLVASYSSNSNARAGSEININFSSNKLMGDTEYIVSGNAGYDSLSIGDGFQNTVGGLETVSNDGGAASSEILLNFKIFDNTLLGDADNVKSSNSGNDVISLGNNIINLFGGINSNANAFVVAFGALPISSTFSANFSLGSNTLIGDAVSIESSSAGDDVISVGNNFQNYLGSITNRAIGGLSVYSTESASFSLSDNFLIGDAKYMNGVSGGKDVIELGNNFKNNFGTMTSNSNNFAEDELLAKMTFSAIGNTLIGDSSTIKYSNAGDDEIRLANNAENIFAGVSNIGTNVRSATISETFTFNVSNNTLIGDAENMKNSHSGNDEILVASAFSSAIGFIQNNSNGNMAIVDTSLLLDYALSENKIMGDSQNMQNSNGGDDNIFVGENIKSAVISISNNISYSGIIESKIISNFSLADNILLGDAEYMHNSSGGHDNIILGNNFKNNIGPVSNSISGGFLLESSFLSVFSLSDNALYGDAKVMSHSQGGNDIISLGNGFVSTVSEITSSVVNNSTAITTVSLVYTLENNNLYGDAETMSYSKGGNDTLSIGVGIEGDSTLTLDITDNTLYGDANTMQRSQGGDDKLTGADGEGSVTYLYGDAKFTDGKSGAGNDMLISGHGNDHMWGDFGSYLHRVNLHDDDEDDDRNERYSEHDDDDDDHHDSEHEDNSHAIYVNYSTGKDIFVFGGNNGNDTIYDFQRGLDKIDFRSLDGIDSIDDFTITSSLAQPSNSVIDFGNGNSITLVGVNDLSANDFMFAAVV